MKTKILTFFILISGIINASPIDTTMAKIVAGKFYYQLLTPEQQLTKKALIPKLVHTEKSKTEDQNTTDIYHVFNMGINEGFVIVSADDDYSPILGFSTSGHYQLGNHSDAYLYWMRCYSDQILHIKKQKIKNNEVIKQKWEELKSGQPQLKSALISVGPLIKTKWGQGSGYNNNCPNNPVCGRTVTGCVATAMAQILKYWGDKIGHSTSGTESHSYDCPFYGTQTADFANTTYNWSSMPLSSGNSEVARLMYHCGVSVEMNYGVSECLGVKGSGSSALTIGKETDFSAYTSYINFWGYEKSTIRIVDKYNDKVSDSEWYNYIKNELDNGRPVHMRGNFDSGGGHSWICDGYRNDGYFYMNWGWDATDDGAYLLTDLDTKYGKNDYGRVNDYGQAIIIGIQPSDLKQCVDQFEDNNSVSKATLVFANALNDGSSDYPLSGNIGYLDDQDWYKVNIAYPGILTISLTDLPYNYDLELYGPSGLQQWISGSYNTGNTAESLTYNYSGNSTTVYAKVYSKTPSNYTLSKCYSLRFKWTPKISCPLSGITPTLVSPGSTSSPGQLITTTSPILKWNAVNGASTYSVFIRDLSTNNLIYEGNEITTGTSIQISPGILENNGHYRWNIQSITQSGNCVSNYSQSYYFQVQNSTNHTNDEPCDAELLDVQSSCSYETKTIVGATKSTQIPDASCDQPSNVDVWFKFTIPSGKFSIHTNSVSISSNDCGLAIYTGNCTSLTERYCTKGGNPSQSYMPWDDNIDLSAYAGQTAYIRIWEYGSVSQTGDFQICIVSEGSNNNDDNCNITVDRNSYDANHGSSSFSSESGEEIIINGLANCKFEVSGICDWLTVSPENGTLNSVGQAFLNYSIDENNSVESKECTFYVNGCPITISQDGIDENDNDYYIENKSVTQTTIPIGGTIDVSCEWAYYGSNKKSKLGVCHCGYFFSKDSKFSPDDFLLEESEMELGSDDTSDSEKTTLTLPLSADAGTAYILFVADYKYEFSESDEYNNVENKRITLSKGYSGSADDFFIDNAFVANAIASPGGNLEAYYDICYSGPTPVENLGSSTVYTYISKDHFFDNTDLYLYGWTFSLNKTIQTKHITRELPSDLAPGSYYLILVADAQRKFEEIDESNNFKFAPFKVVSQPQGNDFYVNDPKISASSSEVGNVIDISCLHCYVGPTFSENIGNSFVGFYLSKDTIIDVSDKLIGNSNTSIGRDDPANKASLSYTIPADINSGNYYILFVADYNKQFNETNETNNIVFKEITIKNTWDPVEKLLEQGNVKIYPNPTTGIFEIDGLPEGRNARISIYTIDGKLILDKLTNSSHEKIDLSKEVSGTYLLTINDGSMKIIKK